MLPARVADAMKYKGKYVAAPVNVHRGTGFGSTQEALNKAGGKAPGELRRILRAADKFKAQGLVAIAARRQPWQDATVSLESVVPGAAALF